MLLLLAFQAIGQRKVYYKNRSEPVRSTDEYLFYDEIRDITPDSSYVKEYGKLGNLQEEGAFAGYGTKTEKPLGAHRKYYKDGGALKATIQYTDGKETEIRSYYPSGKLKRIQTYDGEGKPKGECFEEDGSPRAFTPFEQIPQFPGGENALMTYISENIAYPKKAFKKNIQGIVYASFVVNKNGTISDIAIVKGLKYGCNEEVVRMLSSMPVWEPGKADDVPLKVKFTLPVKFKIK
ncbi:MAG: energy transducer TonB [Bacteroidota bacterium]